MSPSQFSRAFALTALLLALASAGPAPPCDSSQCQLPDCLCSSTNPPGGYSPEQVPQIVYLTFQGAMTTVSDGFFDELFGDDSNYTNPDGCPFQATHFINHVNSDYRLVNKWWSRGHEIAVESISYTSNVSYWALINQTGWELEMDGMRTLASEFANIPVEDMQGMRAPDLQNGGDLQFGMLYDKDFLYDATMPTKAFGYIDMDDAMWPYSMDYKSTMDCEIEPCVYSSYPGVWEQPILVLEDERYLYDEDHGQPCAMLDGCLGYPDADPSHITDMLIKNFERVYNGTRAPFGVHTQAAYFVTPQEWHYEGYKQFLDYLLNFDDVYVVTMQQGLEFVRNPASLENVMFSCGRGEIEAENECDSSTSCYYPTSNLPEEVAISGEKYMGMCCDSTGCLCPPEYPWLNNPTGSSN